MNKKILAGVLSISLMPMLPIMAAEKPAGFTLYDDFESYSSKAELMTAYSEGSGTNLLDIKDVGGEHGKVCEIGLRQTDDNTMMRVYTNGRVSGRIHMKFSICMNNGLSGNISFVNNNVPYSLAFFEGGSVYAGSTSSASWATEPSGAEMMKYTEGEWYDVDTVLDLDSDYLTFTITSPEGLKRTQDFRQFRQAHMEPWVDVKNIEYFVFQTWSKKDGAIYIDDLSIEEQPVTSKVKTACLGNMFSGDEDEVFDVTLKNNAAENRTVKVSYTADTDRHGECYSEDETVTISGGEEYKKKVTFRTGVFDTGQLRVKIDDGVCEPITEEYRFSVVNKCTGGERNLMFGTNAHDMRDRTGLVATNPVDLDRLTEIAQLKADAGIGWERGGIEWKSVEKIKGELEIPAAAKHYVKALTDRGVKFMPIFSFGNRFYDQGGPPYTDEGIAAYVRYATFMYSELHPLGVDTVEIWNEYDLEGSGFNTTSRPPEDYRRLLIETSKALRAMDPNIKIVGGAIAEADNLTWLGTVLDEGGLQAMDYLSIHPYNHAAAPESNIARRLGAIKDLMKNYGEPVPIWVTELGWYTVFDSYAPTPTMYHTYSDLAAWHVRAPIYMDALDLADTFMQYNFSDVKETRSASECAFGMTETDQYAVVPFAAKPAYLASANMNKMLANARFIEQYNPDDSSHIVKYQKKDGSLIYTAWCYDKRRLTSFRSDVPVSVYDMYGNEQGIVKPYNGVINIMLTDEPCYLKTTLGEIEFTEPTIAVSNTNVTAVQGDRVELEISCPDASESWRVSASCGTGGTVSENAGFVNGTARVATDVTTAEEAEECITEVRVADDKGNIFYIGSNYAKILDDTFDVKITAKPYDFSNLNRWQAVIEIKNNAFSRVVSGTVAIADPDDFRTYCKAGEFRELKGGESAIIKIHFPEMVKKKTTDLMAILDIEGDKKYTYNEKINFAVATYAHSKPKIDGIIGENEWTGTVLSMGMQNATILNKNESFMGDEDLSADIRLMWDEDHFYALFDITDDKFSQNFKDVELWRGDSVQFGITDPNSVYVTEFTETGAGLTADGVDMWRWSSTAANNDVWEGVEAEIVRRDDGHTIYELKIPWSGLIMKPEEIKDYYDLGFNIVLNDADGAERKGIEELAWGIGIHKNSSEFTRLILEKPGN
ncbi:MAG: hypothetical protein IJH37_00210 [Clostridia bacterium]|nr:hypothetical protein [Clostridia bacterium]